MQAELFGSACVFYGTLMGNRTPDSAVRGRRLNRLTMRAYRVQLSLLSDDITKKTVMQAYRPAFSKQFV